ncbi:MAG: acyltransferase [Oscillospiraceae bacterium]|nr:acyltransferase [Oscillospiraceae bacterium]
MDVTKRMAHTGSIGSAAGAGRLDGSGSQQSGIDAFRLVAAFLVVGIHTFPLASISDGLDFMFTRVFSRIAVPFFLMASGYFILPRFASGDKRTSGSALLKNLKKTGLIYAAASILFLPVSIYAGHYSGDNVAAVLKKIVFDGTFYHLWYLPASMIGMLLLYFPVRRFSVRAVLGVSVFLYVLGLFGDSYYGLIAGVPALEAAYGAAFKLFSYTRNGLLYAPVFLAMGAFAAQGKPGPKARACALGFAVSMLLMFAEGFLLRRGGSQRHDSMYIMLLPCMYFLFGLARSVNGRSRPFLRNVSMLIYILHPMSIVAVRGAAKVVGLTALLVDNSVGHYLAVCLVTVPAALVIAALIARIAQWRARSRTA